MAYFHEPNDCVVTGLLDKLGVYDGPVVSSQSSVEQS